MQKCFLHLPIGDNDEVMSFINGVTHKGYVLFSFLTFVFTLRSHSQTPLIRSGAGADAAAIQGVIDQFRADLGQRREINWDGVPDELAAPNFLPGNFFNSRGAFFSTPGTE